MPDESDASPAAILPPSPEVVNGLLQWPKDLRRELAHLLLGSVQENFSSLEEAEANDRAEIRCRTEALLRGETPLRDWRESLDEIERNFREKFPQ